MDDEKYLILRNADPLGNLIRDRWHWSPATWGFLAVIVNAIVQFGSAALFGSLYSRTDTPGLFQDIGAVYVILVMQPVIHGYYIWSIYGARSLMKDLLTSKVFADRAPLDRSLERFGRRLESKWGLAGAIACGLFITLLLLGIFRGWYPGFNAAGWLVHSELLPLIQVPIWFITSYALFFALYNVAVTIVTLRGLFREHAIALAPWHPDGCGGLRSISQYSTNLSFALAAVGVGLSTITVQLVFWGTFDVAYEVWLALAAYVIVAPLIFFLPLGTAHTAMSNARDRALLLLSEQFDEEYAGIGLTLNGAEAPAEAPQPPQDHLGPAVTRLENLRKLYEFTADFPVWPFDVSNLRRFLAVAGAAIAPAVLSIGGEVLKSLLQ